jgi:hypothetical protein
MNAVAEPPAVRRLGEARDMAGLHAILRDRATELEVTRDGTDHLAGLTSGHAAKLLCWPPMKHYGHRSLGPMLGALGVKIVVEVDAPQLERIRHRQTKSKRKSPLLMPPGNSNDIVRHHLALAGRRGGRASAKARTAKQRSEHAAHAARSRWQKAREERP